MFYGSIVMFYGSIVKFTETSKKQCVSWPLLQNRAARIVMGMTNDTPGLEAITALGWETLESQRAKSKAVQMYKVLSEK